MAKYNIEDIGGEVKASYYKKLKDVNLDCCPYQVPSDAWKSNPTRWLDLEFPDIYVYLIETPDIFIREFMKNKTGSNFMILRADIMPSQRLNENPHLPRVAINLRGTLVETAHCTCMAGLGELCSHIGALLFKLEAAIRAGFTKKLATVMLLARGIKIL